MSLLDDEHWPAAVRRGDPDALRELEDYVRRTLAKGFARQVSQADLEDLSQDTLVRIHEKLDTFRGDSRFTTWAAAIAVNTALQLVRRRRHQVVSLEDAAASSRALLAAPAAPARLQRAQAHAILAEAIDDALTPLQREALLAELGGIPLAEIARRMGKKRGTLYKLLHDARKRLRVHLEARDLHAEMLLTEGRDSP